MTSSGRRPWRRRALLALLLLIATPLLSALVLILALRSAGVRAEVLARVAELVERSSGVRVTAEAVTELDVWRGVVELRGVTVATEDGPPFLTAERARGVFDWSSLFADRYVVQEAEVEAPVFDASAPLPQGRGDGTGGGSGVDLPRVRIRDGTLFQDFSPARGWLDGYRVERVDGEGSYVGNRVDFDVARGTALLRRADGGPPVELQLHGAIRGPEDGIFVVESLAVTGDGLRLAATGDVGAGAGAPIYFAFDLDAEPARLLPKIAAGAGQVTAEGRLELRSLTGEVRARAESFPPEVVEPWLGRDLLARLNAAGTRLDLDAELQIAEPRFAGSRFTGSRFNGSRFNAVTGRAELAWHEAEAAGGATLLRASAHTLADAEERAGVAAVLEAELLPGAAGERRLSGEISAAAWEELAQAEVQNGRLTVDVPDLAVAYAELRGRWPELVPALPEEWRLAGAFAGRADFAGALLDPAVEVAASWRPAVGGAAARVEIAAAGSPFPPAGGIPLGTARAELSRVDLGAIGLTVGERRLAGVVDGVASVDTRPAATGATPWVGSLELDAVDLALISTAEAEGPVDQLGGPADQLEGPADQELTVDALHLSAAADAERIRLTSLTAASGARRLSATGELWRERPVRRAVLQVEVDDPAAGVQNAELFADLTDGVLHLRLPAVASDAGTLSAVAEVPLATLGSVPQLRALLADLPLVTAGGPISAQLSFPEVDSRTLLPLLGVDDFRGQVRGGVDARLLFDPARPEALRGQVQISDLRVEVPGERAEEPFQLVFSDSRFGVVAELGDGALRLAVTGLESNAGNATLAAAVPLAVFREVPALAATLEAWDLSIAAGPIALLLEVRDFDSRGLAPFFGAQKEPSQRVTANVRAALEIDPAAPAAARGRAVIEDLRITLPDHTVEAAERVVVELRDERLVLPPSRLTADSRSLEMSGEAQLRIVAGRGENGGGSPIPEVAVERLELRADGVIDAGLLTPYLAGGVASGPLEIEARVSGPPDALTAELTASGPEASLHYLSPYPTQITAPQIELRMVEGELVIESARADLNQGEVSVTGWRTSAGLLTLDAELRAVRYRLDYGLTLIASGELELVWPPSGPQRLSGDLVIERGVLRRDLDVDRELLNRLFGPPELAADPGTLDDLELDLRISTVDGVRIKNNVADLRASWSPLIVRGTFAAPVISGGIDVEPGGLIYAYGQTVRLDKAQLTFTGQPGVAPEIDVQTTSSLADPTLGASTDRDLFAAYDEGPASPTDLETALTSGLATYYGERIASRLGRNLGQAQINVRPLLVFGETEPDARLTVSYDLSPTLAFAVALNLREAQSRTYLLDLHDLEWLPRFSAQAFTNDEDNAGGTIQQIFQLGGGPAVDDADLPRLQEIVIEHPPTVSRSAIRRAIPFSKRDPVPEGADFDVEVDVIEALARRGFPDPQVDVRVVPLSGAARQVELRVAVEPGPRADFVFEGDKPPRSLRRSITSLYRLDFFAEASLAEMREQTVKAFHSLGYPDPQVEVTAEPAVEGADGAVEQRVRIRVDAGEKQEIDELRFTGLDPAAETEVLPVLASRFVERGDRIELAVGEPRADRRLLATLQSLGYPDAEVAGRDLDAEQERLTVRLAPGERQRISEVRITGVDAAERERLAAKIPLGPGKPLRSDQLATAALTVESDFRQRGYADARVRPVVVPPEGEEVAIELRVTPGLQQRLQEVRIEGEQATRERWMRRIVDLEPGSLINNQEIVAARRRLLETGTFAMVQVDTAPESEAGAATVPEVAAEPVAAGPEAAEPDTAAGATVPTDLVFTVRENPRYTIGAGVRYETSEGAGAVLDLVDRSFLGRGATVGLRALYAEQKQALRLYSVVHRIFASKNDLELFTEQRTRQTDTLEIDSYDFSAQLSRKLRERLVGRLYSRYTTERTRPRDPSTTETPSDRIDTPYVGVQLVYGGERRLTLGGTDEGPFASLDLSGSNAALGSDQDFLRLFGQVNFYKRLPFARKLLWGQSYRVGVADAFDQSLFRTLRFFAGGEYSVRGYGTESLGPRQQNDDGGSEALGGEALFIVNQELRFPVWQDLSGVVFFDAGNVWLSPDDLGSELFKSVGVGARYQSPIGLLRLDLAYPLDRRAIDDEYKVYFGFGHAF